MASDDVHPFKCAICLDLAYKPIVQACGHVFCFWCVHHSMNGLMHSHCPICRSGYEHFPQICGLLHRLLARVFPVEYEKKGAEVREDEVESSTFAPESSYSSQEGSGEALTVDDLPCEVCKKLLWRPIVLNCGHVFCEFCVPPEALHSNIPKGSYSTFSLNCLTCSVVHKYPLKVCLELDDFIQKTFPDQYKQRAGEGAKPVLTTTTTEIIDQTSSSPASSSLVTSEPSSVKELHVWTGCDQCGIYPIQGPRYHCLDCPEKIGYDLCEECYTNQQQGSCVPGRFNQKHTLDHRMLKIDPRKMSKLLFCSADEEPRWQFIFPGEPVYEDGEQLEPEDDATEHEVEQPEPEDELDEEGSGQSEDDFVVPVEPRSRSRTFRDILDRSGLELESDDEYVELNSDEDEMSDDEILRGRNMMLPFSYFATTAARRSHL